MTTEIFSVREGHLISLAASVAAGCLPCAGCYLERATQAGVGSDELREAIALAESVRRQATDDVVARVQGRLCESADEPRPVRVPADDMAMLLSLTAAYAMNSQALVTALLNASRARHLPPERIVEAVQTARGVRNMAITIVDRCIERESGPGGTDEPASCVCG